MLASFREAGIMALLLFAPLPYGGVMPWAQAIIEGAVVVLAGLSVASMLGAGTLRLRRTPLLWPGLAMLGVVLVQLARPGALASPHATWESLRLYGAYFLLLLILGDHLVTRARIVRLTAVLVGSGVVFALLGRQNQTRGGRGILWLARDPDAHLGRLTSTFVNPNHQALHFAVLLFLALGLLLAVAGRRDPAGRDGDALRPHRTVGGPPALVGLAGAIVALGGALVLTGSRGGLLSVAVGLAVVAALALRARVARGAVTAAAGVLLLGALAYASAVGLGPVLSRVLGPVREPIVGFRGAIWSATLATAGEAPWLGVGLAGFEDAFTRHRPAAVPARYAVDYAHNDYLQLLAETGVVGLAVLAWAVVALLAFVLRRWTARRDPFVRGLTIGGLGALAAVLVHSALDFGLHLPGNALLVVFVAALLPVLVTLRRYPDGDRVGLREWRVAVGPRARVAGLAATVAAVLVAGVVLVPAGLADWHRQRAEAALRTLDRAPGRATVEELQGAKQALDRAVGLDPGNPDVLAARGRVATELALLLWRRGADRHAPPVTAASAESRAAVVQALLADAHEAWERSLRARPRAADLHERQGWFLAVLEAARSSGGVGPPDPRLAHVMTSDASLIARGLESVRRAVELDPQNAYRHRSLALYALTYLRSDPAAGQLAAEAFRRALALEPALAPDAADRLVAVDAKLLAPAIPREPALLLQVGRHLALKGQVAAALPLFEDALALASGPTERIGAHLAMSQAHLRNGDPAAAVRHAREALVLDPRSPAVYAALAAAYETAGQWTDAQTALATAVGLADGAAGSDAAAYRERLAALLARRGERDRALAVRQDLVRSAPRDARGHVELARLHEQRGTWAEAFREYRLAESLGQGDARVLAEVAQAYLRNGLAREAALAYAAVARLEPADLESRLMLAQLYTRLGWRDKALEQYREIAARQPGLETARPPAPAEVVPLGGIGR